jgi:hypothetical protein
MYARADAAPVGVRELARPRAGPFRPPPRPYLLADLAAVYGCAVTDLIDLPDREHLPPADLLILDKYSQRGVASGPVRRLRCVQAHARQDNRL